MGHAKDGGEKFMEGHLGQGNDGGGDKVMEGRHCKGKREIKFETRKGGRREKQTRKGG